MDKQSNATKFPILKIALCHVLVGLVVFIALFLTVHNRNVNSNGFQKKWVDTITYQDRWNDLIDHWREDGYFKNAGLWYLNIDRPFQGWTKNKDMYNSGWISSKNFNPEAEYYYKSNPGIVILPLTVMQHAKIAVLGGDASRRVSVLHNQGLVLIAGILLGLVGTIMCRRMGLSLLHALALGVCAQIVFQTHPLNLASFFRLYFQHAMNVPICLFVLSLVLDDGKRPWQWIRAISIFLLTLSEPSTTIIFIAGYAVLNVLVDGRLFKSRSERLGESLIKSQRAIATVFLPCVIALGLILVQYIYASLFIPNIEFVGSNPIFRTGLDGHTKWHSHLFEAFNGMLFKNYLYGSGTSNIGGSPAFWIPGFVAIFATILAAAWSRKDGDDQAAVRATAYYIALLSLVFFPVAIIFNNAMAIHPFIYPLMILPPMCLAMFAFVPALVAISARYHWPIVGVAALIAFAVTMSNLRYFAVTFPIQVAG